MRNAAVAEWILSLVIEPERAATTVGDLVEEASSRGGVLWFWSSVLRTAGSHLWRDLSASPRRVLISGFGAWLEYFAFGGVLGFVILIPWYVLVPWKMVGPGTDAAAVPDWVYSTLAVLLETAVPLYIGWRAAARWPGREVASGISVVTVFTAVYFLKLYLSTTQMNRGHLWHMEHDARNLCVEALFVLAGALLFRALGARRRLRFRLG